MTVKFLIAISMVNALEDPASVIPVGRAPFATNLTVPILTAAATALVSLASVTARPAGRASGAIRSISKYTNVCPAVPITARTTSNLLLAFAKSTGPGSIAHSRVAVWTADLTDPASRVVANVTTIGPERNAIKNRAMHVAPNMASARMEPVYAVKDGTEDIARYPDVKMDAAATDYAPYRMANIVANVRLDGPGEIAVYDLNWNVMITLTMMKMA